VVFSHGNVSAAGNGFFGDFQQKYDIKAPSVSAIGQQMGQCFSGSEES
jgi:hypothetical protein